VPQVGSGATIYDPVYLQPKIFQLSSVSHIFQQYGDVRKARSGSSALNRDSGVSTGANLCSACSLVARSASR